MAFGTFGALAPKLAVRGVLKEFTDAAPELYLGARTVAIKKRAGSLKNIYRRQARSAGLGARFANTMRVDFPNGEEASAHFAAVVRSVALYRNDKGGNKRTTRDEAQADFDLWQVFDTATRLRAVDGPWLAIPLTSARSTSERRLTPEDFQKGSADQLVVIQPNNEPHPLLIDRETGEAFFVLVRQVTLKKRLNLSPPAKRAEAGLDEAVSKEIERALAKWLSGQGVRG